MSQACTNSLGYSLWNNVHLTITSLQKLPHGEFFFKKEEKKEGREGKGSREQGEGGDNVTNVNFSVILFHLGTRAS